MLALILARSRFSASSNFPSSIMSSIVRADSAESLFSRPGNHFLKAMTAVALGW